ncbi:MAG: ectoine/hydroxyectoine ABC transporter substrate-binding protein EhuB [Carbonactinosporaceae bacterium]
MSERTWTRRDFLGRAALGVGGLTAVGGTSLLTACQRTEPGTGQAAGSTLQRIKDQGYVKVGYANEAPYAFEQDGQLKGEDPAVSTAIFKALGVDELRPEIAEFGSLIPGLAANRWDVVTAGMFILPERCSEADFSEPVYCASSAFMVKKGNPKNLETYQDLAKTGAVMGALTGAVEPDYATGAGVNKSKIKSLASQQDGLEALLAGRIDAFALTSFSLNYLAETNKGAAIEVTTPFIPTIDGEKQIDCGGAVFRRGDDDLRKAYNRELAKLKQSGRLLELIQPWGFGEETIPPKGLTTAELCKA